MEKGFKIWYIEWNSMLLEIKSFMNKIKILIAKYITSIVKTFQTQVGYFRMFREII